LPPNSEYIVSKTIDGVQTGLIIPKEMIIEVGTKVKMVNCLEAEKYKDCIWEVASEPWKVGGKWVVLLDRYSGGFAVENLEAVKEVSN